MCRSSVDLARLDLARPKSKRTNSWTGAGSSIQDSFTSFANALQRDAKERRTSIQLPPAPCPAPGSSHGQQKVSRRDQDQQHEVDKLEVCKVSPTTMDNGSARRGRLSLSLSGLIIPRPAEPQARQPVRGQGPLPELPMLAPNLPLDGVRQQQQHPQNPSQLNRPRMSVSSSFSQPPQLPRPTRVSPLDLLSPSSPWSPPASDTTTPSLAPPPHSFIGSVDHAVGANSQLASPVSEPFSSSHRPTPIAKDQDDNCDPSPASLDIADRLRVPAPISKYQPTWNPYTGTPLVEEEDFELYKATSSSGRSNRSNRSRDPTDPGLQAQSIPLTEPTDNRDAETDRNVISPATWDEQEQGSDSADSDWVVLAPGTTEIAEETEPDTRSRKAREQGQRHRIDEQPLSDTASMAAYSQQPQQQQPQLQPQQFNHPSYPNAASGASHYQGQYNQAHGNHPGWHTQAQTPNQAWEQSQRYDYQPQQGGQGLGRQPQQPLVQQYQYGQPQPQQYQQQSDNGSPHRQSSFVGLPPIRRTSTLLSSVVKAGGGDDDSTSIASSQHTGQAQAGSSSQAMAQSQFGNQAQVQSQSPLLQSPQQYQITGGYRPSQPGVMPQHQQPYNNAAQLGLPPPGTQGSPQPQHNFPQAGPGQPGVRSASSPITNGDPRFPDQGPGNGQGAAPRFIPHVMRQGLVAVTPNAGGPIRLPPQGAWKLEESHLQQPLLSSSRNRSSSNTAPQEQPFYGFDKETGLPAPAPAPSQQPQQPPQASQAGQLPSSNAPHQPQPGQLPRTDTADTGDLPPPGPIHAADDKQARRNSGLFSHLRERFTKDVADDRRESSSGAAGGQFQVLSRPSLPTSDAISESSVATEELQERRKRHSIFGLRGSPNTPPLNASTTNLALSNGQRGDAQGSPGHFEQRTQQSPQSQQFQQPEKKKTFFGGGATSSSPPQTQGPLRPDLPRTSTSSNADAVPPPTGINGGPKKRFSGLTSIFNRSGNHQEQGPKQPGGSHTTAPSFNQGLPGGPQGFAGPVGPPQGQPFARPPGAPGSVFGQQQQPQPGAPGQLSGPGTQSPPVQQQRLQDPQQGQQPGQQSPPQQQGQFQQVQPGQQPGQQRPVGQQSPNNIGSPQSPDSQPDGQKAPQGQQYPFPGPSQQQGQHADQRPDQQPGQQTGQQSPSQQHLHQFQQQRQFQQPSRPQPGQQLPSQQQLQQQRQAQQAQQPGPQQPSLQSASQQQQRQQPFQQLPVQQLPNQPLPGQQQRPQQFQQQRPPQQQPGQQQPGQQQQQLGLMGPPPPIGRGRSDSAGSRPFTPGDARPNPMMAPSSSSPGEDRGRKPVGGGFFSSIFGGRSGSKPRDPKPGAPGQVAFQPQVIYSQPEQQHPVQQQYQPSSLYLPGQQRIPPSLVQVQPQDSYSQPGQQQNLVPIPGQPSNHYLPGQQRIPLSLVQLQQQQGARPIGSPAQFGPTQAGQHQPGQTQFGPQGGPGQQQLWQTPGLIRGQQRPVEPGQQPSQNVASQGLSAAEQGQAQAGGDPRPGAHRQQQSQKSQATSPLANASLGQQQLGPRTIPPAQPYAPQKPVQERETIQRTSLGPLNQHPLASNPPLLPSPPPSQFASQQETTRQETVSPPLDDSTNKVAGPPGSPPLTSPVSEVSHSISFTPVERQSNDSPLSFRQPPPSQQHEVRHSDAPRQIPQASIRTPSTEPPARKPVQSSPRQSEPSLAHSVQAGADHSKGSPSISSAHTVTATSSPVDHSRKPSIQQLGPPQTTSPLAQQPQQPQTASQQQSLQRVPVPGQAAAPQHGSDSQTGFPGVNAQASGQPSQAQGGPPGNWPANQQGMRLVGHQSGEAGTPTPGQQGQPYPGPQPPWSRTSTSVSGPVPQQGQQIPGPWFQTHPPRNGSPKEHQGTISKLFRSKESNSFGPSNEKPVKEKGGKSRFGFLRSSKQPESTLRQQQPQQLQGGPQFQQGPPGRPVMPQESNTERLKQLQAQVSDQDQRPNPNPTPSPKPFLQYQQQRQSPPNGVTSQAQPAAGGQATSSGPQRVPSSQGAATGPPQQQYNTGAAQQQGVPPPGEGRPVQGSAPPSGPQDRAQFELPKPVNQRPVLLTQKSNEPQYGEVPIPTGYGKVHSEGRLEPAPVAYYMGPGGQFLPVQTNTPGSQHQYQPWVQPGMVPRQPSYGAPSQQRIPQSPGQSGQSQPLATRQPSDRTPVGSSPAAAPPAQTAGHEVVQQPDPQQTPAVRVPDQQAPDAFQAPRSDTPRATPTPNALSPTPPAQGASVAASPGNIPSRPEPERFDTALSQQSNVSSPPPQVQHPGSPQSYPLPDAPFSPVNPVAVNILAPPLPDSDLVPPPLRPFSTQKASPQRQVSGQVSADNQVSSLQPGTSTPSRSPSASLAAQVVVNSEPSQQGRSPSPQVSPEPSVTPQPPSLSPPTTMNINVQQANDGGVDHDNIYDATPRTASIPLQQPSEGTIHVISPPPDDPPEEPAEPKASGTSHEVLEHRDQQPKETSPSPPVESLATIHSSPSPSPPPLAQPQPIHQAVAAGPSPSNNNVTNNNHTDVIGTISNGQTPPPVLPTPPPARQTPPAASGSSGHNPADVFEEAKRRAQLRDMEEKIPVFPTEPDVDARALAEMAARKKAEEERPQMSATSYPGQEWNPYGDGYEEWD